MNRRRADAAARIAAGARFAVAARVTGVTRAMALLSLLAGAGVCLVLCGSCGSNQTGDTVLAVDQALSAESGQAVRVQGFMLATDTETVLASALLESYPPQAGGATLPVSGLGLDAIVGLSSTADQPDLVQTTWSDFPVTLDGAIEDGVLEVKVAPVVVETGTTEVRVRFSPIADLLSDGNAVWWVFDVTNLTAAPLELTFANGQKGDVVLSQNGVEKYRWSAGKAFTEAIEMVTLQPGKKTAIVLNDTVQLAPGTYDLVATVTASVGSGGVSGSLPEISTTFTVR